MKGMSGNAPSTQDVLDLQHDDRLVLFTDGLTEAVDASGEQFGEERLIRLLREHRHESAEDLKEILFNAVGEFCGDTFHDDAALMVVGFD